MSMEIKVSNGRNRLKHIIYGMKSIYMPTFYRKEPLKFKIEHRTDGERLISDYRKSLKGIHKEVQSFESIHRK